MSCSAKDAVDRPAICQFTVTVTVPTPVLLGTTFLAFGDSLTAGENGLDGTAVPCASTSRLRPQFIDCPNSYPTQLQALLQARYTSQSPIVINDGRPGDQVADEASNIRADVATYRPDALLLLEGANDLIACSSPADVAQWLVDVGQLALAGGTRQVFLSTLPPGDPGQRGSEGCYLQSLDEANADIRAAAAANGFVLVDAYSAVPTSTVGPDGLHLTPAGYSALAEAFLGAIAEHFEQSGNAARVRLGRR